MQQKTKWRILSQRNPLGVVREDGFAHHGNGHIEYGAPRLDVTGIAKLLALPFLDTLQSQPAHTLAIALIQQGFDCFVVLVNPSLAK
ncbi:MAG: hypothetical protein Q7J38_03250 [Gallionella sp.]|nr:hypothetical protein [Gallionella sp.]